MSTEHPEDDLVVDDPGNEDPGSQVEPPEPTREEPPEPPATPEEQPGQR